MNTAFADRLYGQLGKAAAACLLVLLLLAIAEASARLLHRPEPIRRVYDPFAYKIPSPGLVDEFARRDGQRVTVRLNELGMRGPSVHEPVAPETLTVVFLGGSTTENYAFDRHETFPELAGRGVAAAVGRPLRVMNAGASAATVAVSLGRLQHQVLALAPDLVVVMHAINDLIWGFHPDFRSDSRHLPRPPLAGRRPRSYLVDGLRVAQWRFFPEPRREARGYLARHDFEDFPARLTFARHLRSLAAISKAHGIPLLLLTQPAMYRESPASGDAERFALAGALAGAGRQPPDLATLARGMAAFNQTTLAVAEEAGVRAFDLAARIPRSRELIYDECHYTKAGNRRVAAELVPTLEEILGERFARLRVDGQEP